MVFMEYVMALCKRIPAAGRGSILGFSARFAMTLGSTGPIDPLSYIKYII